MEGGRSEVVVGTSSEMGGVCASGFEPHRRGSTLIAVAVICRRCSSGPAGFLAARTAALVMIVLIIGCAVAMPSTASEAGEPPVREARRHFALQATDGLDDFTVTIVDRGSELSITTKVLVQDSHGARFLLSWDLDFVHHTSVREIREVGGSEFIRYTLFLPFAGRTRSATQEEAHSHPELLSDRNAHFELGATGNSAISGSVDSWKDVETARQWRSRARLMLSPTFIDEIELLETAGIFRNPILGDFDSMLLPLVLYRTECEPKAELRAVPVPPDCGFDKRFGFDCSDQQKERVEKLWKQKPPAAKPY